MSLALNMPRIWIYQGSVYVFDFKYARVLNIAGFCICPWFWICQGSEYTSVLNMLILPRVLNMSEFARMIPEYAWLDLNMSKYAGICVNMPKSTWIAFVWHVPIVSPWLLECVVTYFNKVFSLKEHDAVFMKQNLIFSIVAGSIWINRILSLHRKRKIKHLSFFCAF